MVALGALCIGLLPCMADLKREAPGADAGDAGTSKGRLLQALYPEAKKVRVASALEDAVVSKKPLARRL